MMLFKLSLKNIKKSFKDYAIYFLTLVLGVAIFYVFNALDGQQAMLQLSTAQKQLLNEMNTILGTVSVFVVIVLAFLVIYANSFLMKRRKKEFGIYLTLGMSKRNVSKILLLETILIGLFSLVVGLGLGVIASQFMSVIVAKMFEVDMSKFAFVFSQKAMIKTIIYYAIIYVIVMIFNVLIVSRYKLIDLINASKKGEKIKVRSLTLSVIIFILSIIILGIAYYLAINKFNSIRLFGLSILMGILGTFLFFFGVSGFILRLVQNNKKMYFKNLNVFNLRQIDSKISTTVFSMSVICLLLFFTITIFSSAMSLNMALKKQAQEGTPVDAVIVDYSSDNLSIKDSLVKNGFDLNNFSDYVDEKVYFSENYKLKDLYKPIINKLKRSEGYLYLNESIPLIKVSDYNKLAKLYKKQTYNLKSNEYVILLDVDMVKKYQDEAIQKGLVLNIEGKNYKSKYQTSQKGAIELGSNSNSGLVILPDSALTKNYEFSEYLAANYKGNKEKVESKLLKTINHSNLKEFSINTKIGIYQSMVGLRTIITFIGLYIGVIFLISSAAILALKELSESSDNKNKYDMLRRIGVDDKSLNKALFKQIGIFFLCPLIVAIIHSIFGIMCANKMLEILGSNGMIGSIIVTAIFVVLIYGGYFVVTYVNSKRIINERS